MKITGALTLKYKTEESACLVYDSLEVLATIDDLIASEIVSENIIKKTMDS